VGQTIATSGNHVESPANLETASTALRRSSLSWSCGLQQNIAQEKTGKRRTWDPHGQHGYSLGPSMHHYRCQNVYISATASERIVDTLEFFPHNYQMPQLSSTDRLLMANKDMTDALQNPHPEVPLASVGDDTISALADLAAIFKLKLQQTPSTTPQAVPQTIFQRPCLAESSNQILNSPMPISRNRHHRQ
jgi:hypothetical protein